MKILIALIVFFNTCLIAKAGVEKPVDVIIAPGTITATTATLVWDKPADYKHIVKYLVYLNGMLAGSSQKCNYTLKGLRPASTYMLTLRAEDSSGVLSEPAQKIRFTTKRKTRILNVLDFGAKGDASTLNTVFIQKAINACPPGGTVLIPEGIFVTGALFLKSNMTFYIVRGGTIKGSLNSSDYEPFIMNRFEGWEMKTHAALLNAGTMDTNGGYNAENISVRGEGVISGGGVALAKAMIAKAGMRSRGRLICLLNCRNVQIQGLKIEESPCWTIHYIYSKSITCHDLDISSDAENGDGIDPDSSVDSYIFNCEFATGDDCIAVKSGKNPEGYYLAKPTENVRITDCNFKSGHGISIGSEMSGGVKNVVVRDCRAGNLIFGLQIKGTKDRGGFVENVTVKDCDLRKITILTSLPYNNDGAPAPVLPYFKNFSFSDINMLEAAAGETIIRIEGFGMPENYTSQVRFRNILLPENARIEISHCKDIEFIQSKTSSGNDPDFKITNSISIIK